eukprot:TRINITY_DN85794_c0_g1_i1.p1 TRINITY_DN85794_c0_g1~~TRINITY_DN85794_c0_g1_i1.p1  ORF type:complete len:469 (+),score=39.07 TRINITY_DN85794_c0_g1_i1:69-1475(+)
MSNHDDDVHVSSYPWRSRVWRKTRTMKLVTLDSQDVYPVNAYVLACVEIQRIWRGVILRRRVLAKYLFKNFQRQKQVKDAAVMTAYQQLPVAPQGDDRIACVNRCIARCRTVLKKTEYLRWLAYQKYGIYYVAATTIARQWLDYKYRKHKKQRLRLAQLQQQRELNLTSSHGPTDPRVHRPFYLSREDAAAARIQHVWKCYINKQIFRFYVELIRFREQGDAKLMLKCINPKESGLIDSAANMHVRFRLGGDAFPPTIYYKLYTHGPVCDLGRLAPRDYTQDKHIPPKWRHNKTHPSQHVVDVKKWYNRVECNEWRPITDKALRETIRSRVDIYTTMQQSDKAVFTNDSPYHYSKLRKQEDVIKKAKKKKREWMVKLYSQQAAAVVQQQQQHQYQLEQMALSADDGAMEPLPPPTLDINPVAPNTLAGLNEEELEAEVRKLIDWSDTLNFESYRVDWLCLATAAGAGE